MVELTCEADDCDEPITDDDAVVFEDFQMGVVYHKECYGGDE